MERLKQLVIELTGRAALRVTVALYLGGDDFFPLNNSS